MAQIIPIRAWRYHKSLTQDLDSITSPLFDVVTTNHLESLYKNPLNSIHLSVPQTPYPAERASLLLKEWKGNATLVQDKLWGIYVYYQYFKLPGSTREYCRKGFVCNIRLYDWAQRIILRHENTIPHSVNDRIELLEKTELNVSPTHGLYTDPSFSLEKHMDEAITNPVYETEDYQGVRDVMAIIHDGKVIQHFIECIKRRKIILADGHHRYEGSLANMYNQKSANLHHTGNEGYNFHMMYLTNTEADDLRILPTHRLIRGITSFSEEDIVKKLQAYFSIKKIEDATALPEIITGKTWTFGLLFKGSSYHIKLKNEAISKLKWPFPEEIKALDLTILHYFIIEKVLGIAGKEQRKSANLSFNRNFFDCLNKVEHGEAQMGIIVNEVSIEDVKRVCETGFTMPQKSTYFYPKVITGFVMSSIKEDEFKLPVYAPFTL